MSLLKKKKKVPVRLSLKYQQDYSAGTKTSCSHRGYIYAARGGYNHHICHIFTLALLAQASARKSSHMAAILCNPMELPGAAETNSYCRWLVLALRSSQAAVKSCRYRAEPCPA